VEDFLSKALLQSGLGVVGVLALLYVIREQTKIQVELRALVKKVSRVDKKVAVLMFAQGVKVPDEKDDDD